MYISWWLIVILSYALYAIGHLNGQRHGSKEANQEFESTLEILNNLRVKVAGYRMAMKHIRIAKRKNEEIPNFTDQDIDHMGEEYYEKVNDRSYY